MTDERVQPSTERQTEWVPPTVCVSGAHRRSKRSPGDPRRQAARRADWTPPRARVSGWEGLVPRS